MFTNGLLLCLNKFTWHRPFPKLVIQKGKNVLVPQLQRLKGRHATKNLIICFHCLAWNYRTETICRRYTAESDKNRYF